HIPLERIVLETDSPYLTPAPHRGKRNEPSYIPIIASRVAEIKNISIEQLQIATTENALKLFAQ
ncbi:MAG TPA: TatD family hydrolase, partial [Cyclobacteriaceae bacterium]